MTSQDIPCRVCGHWGTRLFTELEEKERADIEIGSKPETLVFEMLRHPLGPPPLHPGAWGCLAFLVIFAMLISSQLDVVVIIPIAFLAAFGAYHGLIRAWYENRLAVWKNTLKGARVCMKCWAAFIPSVESNSKQP